MILLKCLLYSLILVLVGCNNQDTPAKQFDPAQLGLIESTLNRLMVEQAIQMANTIANEANGFQLVPSWQPIKSTTGKEVFVYILRSENLAKSEMIFVPMECKQCVFLQNSDFHDWLNKYSDKQNASLKLDDYTVLAFLLLHELGHVHQGESSGAVNSSNESYNIKDTHQKEIERAADEFAASKIREAASKKGESRATTAMLVEIELSKLSWNLSAIRLLDHFGGTVINSHDLFWDMGYTHPNFELRILTVNNLVTQTETSYNLLKDFKDHIVNQPDILYQRDKVR